MNTAENNEEVSWYDDKVRCPKCSNSGNWMDGVDKDGYTCATCWGAGYICKSEGE